MDNKMRVQIVARQEPGEPFPAYCYYIRVGRVWVKSVRAHSSKNNALIAGRKWLSQLGHILDEGLKSPRKLTKRERYELWKKEQELFERY